MRLFVHICCAPCLDATYAGFRALYGDVLELHGYFYNPNIHPLLEYRKRLKSVHVLNERLALPLTVVDLYDPVHFLRDVWRNGEAGRCARCYADRLDSTARAAREAGYTHYSSTLCVSTQQSHEAIRAAGMAAGERHGVTFVYADLREWVEKTPRRLGLYRQQYCGCLFSEEDRFRNTGQECYRGPDNQQSDT